MYGTTLDREMGRIEEPWAENRNKAPEFKDKVEEMIAVLGRKIYKNKYSRL